MEESTSFTGSIDKNTLSERQKEIGHLFKTQHLLPKISESNVHS